MSARDDAEKALSDAHLNQWGVAGPTQAQRGIGFAILVLADAITSAATTIANARPAAESGPRPSKEELLRRRGISPEVTT